MSSGAFIQTTLRFLCITAVIGVAVALSVAAPPEWRTPPMLALYTLGAAAVLLLSGSLIHGKFWSRPIRRLERAASRMARGEWDVRVQPHGAPAIHSMAVNLNQLAAQAYKQLSDLQ